MSLQAQTFESETKIGLTPVKPASVLAVIPTLNEARHIEACIRSLMQGEAGLRKIPLLVVDGGSTDDTVAIVEDLRTEFPNLSVAHNPKRLQSAALNLAVREHSTSASQWLVRCDAHSIYPENFILDVARSLIETEADSVVVPMDAIGTTCFEKGNAWVVDTPLGSGGAAHRGGRESGYVDHGHHAGFAIEQFRHLGGYDESFSHNEDAEYDARLTQSGGVIFLDADIRIKYIPRSTVSSLAKQYFNYGKGRAQNLRKHKTKPKIRQLLPVIALVAIVFSILITPITRLALFIPFGYLSALILVSAVIAFNKKSVCGLLSGPALGTMHMSWAAGFLEHLLIGRRRGPGGHPPKLENYRPRQSFTSLLSSTGRSALDLFAYVTGRTIAPRPMHHATENYNANRPVTRVTSVPENQCVYAIGDIHGRFDLLLDLIGQIKSDAADLPEGTTPTIVFLGDYIDRGMQSRQIIDYFLSDELSQFETVFLMGNHEEALLNFIQDPNFGQKWAMYGGSETLFSYGLNPPPRGLSESRPEAARDAWITLWHQFRTTLTDDHLAFYQSCLHSHTIGDYVFVHAGLRPGVPMEEQTSEDMMWIREDFLAARGDFERLVVHGHTPSGQAYRDNRRLGLDTGAYITGRLTAAKLYKQEIEYLST